jgi:glucitol operon activator protein
VRGRFGKGVIVLIVVDEDRVVRRFLEMSGRTVFAKFIRQDAFEGLTLTQLRAQLEQDKFQPAVAHAVRSAIEQAERLAEQSDGGEGLTGLKPVKA